MLVEYFGVCAFQFLIQGEKYLDQTSFKNFSPTATTCKMMVMGEM